MNKKKVLLHICCGVCAFAAIKRLEDEDFYVEGFFYNPNIHPESEYNRRLDAAKKVASLSSVTFHQAEYDLCQWNNLCLGYKDLPEGGKRCLLCYELRLLKTDLKRKELGFDYFTTTLTISPHKNSQSVFAVGESVDRESFLVRDFKKQDGFKKTSALAKEAGIYRQDYCGCIYSKP